VIIEVMDLPGGRGANGESRVKLASGESVAGRRPGFRAILSAGTRPLKHPVLELVTDEPRRAGLKKEPRGHRRDFLFQMTGN
jgi:hypothetical protein